VEAGMKTLSPARLSLLLAALGAGLLAASDARANCTLQPGNPQVTPDTRFVDNLNGTVSDTRTGLMWSQTLQGSASTHAQALTLADASTLAGHTDWRLPTRAELVGIVETGCARPALNTTRFTAGATSVVWSSSPGPAGTFWFVDFTYGSDAVESAGTTKAIRLVRSASGQIFADGFE